MKLFTKIAVGIAGVFFGIAVICFGIALAMGVTISDVQTMVRDGKFSFGPEDGFHIQLWGDDEIDFDVDLNNEQSSNDTYMEREISDKCTKLYVELAAGEINIYYDDVEYMQIKQHNVPGFLVTVGDEQSVHIQGDIDVVETDGIELTILLPKDVVLEEVELKIGACQANVSDLIAEKMNFVVGAGQANISNISVNELELEVGAGEAIVKNLSVKELDVEAGVGKVDIEVAGAEVDYNYDVECGIGQVILGNRSFGGLGTEQTIMNDGANHHMNIECGIGEVNMHFSCNITDGTCEEAYHNHSSHNRDNNHNRHNDHDDHE